MLLLNLGQFNYDNWELVNFPDFCGDIKTFVLYLKKIIWDSALKEKIFLKEYFQENMCNSGWLFTCAILPTDIHC